jgi:hypothetical protein
MALSEIDRLLKPRAGDYMGHPYTYTPPVHTRRERWAAAAKRLRTAGGAVASGLRVATAPALRTLSDHWMTIAAAGCADWAAFLWNDKSGLITAAILLVLIEIKVSDLWPSTTRN